MPAEPPEEPDDLDDDPARRERRQHLRQTVDEAAGLLRLLTGGAITALSRNATVRAAMAGRMGRRRCPGCAPRSRRGCEDIAKDWVGPSRPS